MSARTRQQLDPMGTTGLASVTAVLLLGVIAYCAAITLASESHIRSPALALVSLLALGIGAALTVVAANPYRAPLGRGWLVLIVAVVLAAAVVAEVSMWGVTVPVWQHWGAAAIGVLLVALAPYRPATEIVIAGVLTATVLGVLVLSERRLFPSDLPALVVVLAQTTPVLALAIAGAAHARTATRALLRWQQQVAQADEELVDELRDDIARSVHGERLAALERDVVPFFSRVLDSGEVTDADRRQAHQIAQSIRSIMVAEVDRSWLEGVIETAGGTGRGRSGAAADVIHDPDRLAPHMQPRQRAVVRAMLAALVELPGFTRDDLDISIAADGELCRAEFIANVEASGATRAVLMPYLALLRAVFEEVELDLSASALRIKFSYEQH